MYYFSVPMLYKKDEIDYFAELNKRLTKSKIVAFYDALPCNIPDVSGLEQTRGANPYIKIPDDFYDVVKYVKSKGFNFIYLINTTRSIDTRIEDYLKTTKNLYNIINRLKELGCNSFRVGNTSTIQYLLENYKDIDIRTSTTLGFNSIVQYKNLIKTYPQISEFCLHYENNHDFKLLANLVKSIPDVTKEVIVNELCIKGCPYRNSHYSYIASDSAINHDKYFKGNCHRLFFENFWETICKSNIIYPWQLNKYSEVGINNFKIAGRGFDIRDNFVRYYVHYLSLVESEDAMMNADFFSIFQNQAYIMLNQHHLPKIKVKDIIEYLPDINHFIKHGHNCASVCGMECNYCFEKAKILNEKFPINS